MFWDISIVYKLYIHSAKADNTIRYNSNTSKLQVIELLESHVRIIKSRKNNYFSKKLRVRIIRASELIEEIRYITLFPDELVRAGSLYVRSINE